MTTREQKNRSIGAYRFAIMGVMFPFILTTLIVWTVVGFFFWIPHISRAVASGEGVARAFMFFPAGYGLIWSSFNVRPDVVGDELDESSQQNPYAWESIAELVGVLIFSATFWMGLAYALHAAGNRNPLVVWVVAWFNDFLRNVI